MCSLVLNHDVLYLLGTPVSNKEWCILVLTVYIYFVNVQINTAIPASTKLKALQLLNAVTVLRKKWAEQQTTSQQP